MTTTMKAGWLGLAAVLAAGVALQAAEVRSNGRGGGPWSAAGTWRASGVPGPADAVIVASNDVVTFDVAATGRVCCRSLVIDAAGALAFATGDARRVLNVAGPIHVRGALRADGRAAPRGLCELWLTAAEEAERTVHVYSNGAFLAAGVSGGLPDGRPNVAISAGPPTPGEPRRTATLVADPGGALDVVSVDLTHAGEYHSNGSGGGLWMDPATWKERIVPAPGDVVVIASGDTVAFDGHDPEHPSCRRILIDPSGVLTFKIDEAPHTLNVGGGIEAYGSIRIDAARLPGAAPELRLSGAADGQRTVRLMRGAAMLVYGASGAREEPNVTIASGRAGQLAEIVADGQVMLDLHGIRFTDVAVQATGLDNTGFKIDERINIAGCRFAGGSRVRLMACDTPAFQRNVLACGPSPVPIGLWLNACKLADVRDNRFVGAYGYGVQAANDVDSSLMGNVFSNVACAFCWQGQNAMIRQNTVLGGGAVAWLESMGGGIEGLRVTGCTGGVTIGRSAVQFTDLALRDVPTNTPFLKLEGSSVTLLNANVEPGQVRIGRGAPPPGQPWVQSMAYVIVQLRGAGAARAEVELRTAAASGGPPAGAADLNVRNSPARVSPAGLTPLPRSLSPLIVRAWSIDANGRPREAPFYDLIVSTRAADGAAPKERKRMVVEPKAEWFRPDPNGGAPTVAVDVP